MVEETLNGESNQRGILKNKPKPLEKRISVTEPLIVPERAHVLCPTDSPKGGPCAPSDSTTREFLIHKRSSLTHTPDITRVFGQNGQKLATPSGSDSLYEFQKIKLRHVDACGENYSVEEKKKDVVVNMTVGPCKYDFIPAPEKRVSPSRKSSYERSFGERSPSFSQTSPVKEETVPKEMSKSFSSAPTMEGRKPLITRGESNGSIKKQSRDEKRSPSMIFRESQAKNKPDITDNSTNDTKKQSTLKSPSKRSESKETTKISTANSQRTLSPSGKAKQVPPSPLKTNTTSKTLKASSSKENKIPDKSIPKKAKEDKKPSPISSTGLNATKKTLKKSPPSPTTARKAINAPKVNEFKKAQPKSNPSDVKKTPEVRRRVIQKPSSQDRDALKAKSRNSPSLRRKAPSPVEPRKAKGGKEVDQESEDSKKRPERVSGIFRPTKSWLCYMGDKVDIKSRTPSPGESRKKSTGDRKSSAPIRRTESFNKKTSTSSSPGTSLKRSSSLRSSSSGGDHLSTTKGKLSKKSNPVGPPPTLPKPGRTAASPKEPTKDEDSGIEETSIKASSVIQKFEAAKETLAGSSMIGSPEGNNVNTPENALNKVQQLLLLPGLSSSTSSDESSKFTPPSQSNLERNALTTNLTLSPTMVTNEEYSSQRMMSHSRSGSVVSGENQGSSGYQSGEKYKTTMVVRLHPGQTRKLSNCSATTSDSQGLSSNAGSITREASFSNSRKSSVISGGEVAQQSPGPSSSQHHRYSADIHDFGCDKMDSNSCCASGLEITFESPPQTIDIKLIPSPSVEERKVTDNEDDGNNLISQKQINKTRQ